MSMVGERVRLSRAASCAVRVAIVGSGLWLAACSSLTPVKAWERGDLAREEMAWEFGIVDEAMMKDHVYVSKEAASMGPVLSGGGCGCN